MSIDPKQLDPDEAPYKGLIGYFDLQVLASYRNEPDKFLIETDFFHRNLETTNQYYEELEATNRTDEVIDVLFGYRTLQNGNLAIAAFLPDLFEKSKKHVPRWSGFHLLNPQWINGHDERLSLWARRYLGGDWSVGPGVRTQLSKLIHTVNGLTNEAVGKPLFKHELSESLSFPEAENSQRYEDAHRELYGYLIDGLNCECISLIAAHLGRPIKVRENWTVKDLKKLFPNLNPPSSFCFAYDLVSDQRGLAAHKVRPPAKGMPAFEQFTKDLELCVKGFNELLATLEKELNMNGDKATERNEAKKYLPQVVRASEPNYSICQATQMKGKTVERVKFGSRNEIADVHQSEVLKIHFTDGSILGIDTHSNVGNLAREVPGFKGEDVHISFDLHWVPEK